MMGGEKGKVIFDKLEKLFVTLKSFYHPSNYDKHSVSCYSSFYLFVKCFIIKIKFCINNTKNVKTITLLFFQSVLLGFMNALTEKFVTRLNHERFHKPSWMVDIPEELRITDAEIERYVNIIKEVALLSVYSKQGSLQAALTLQNLALLRADLVIPQLLQRLTNYAHSKSVIYIN